MSLKARDGSSTSMTTHSERMTIFDLGCQSHCYWPVLCVGLPRLAGSWWELFLMTAAPLKRCGSKLCLNYLFYHYPTIFIPLFSLPTGFCSDEKRARPTGRLKPVWTACFFVCERVCVFEWMQVCICTEDVSVHHWALLSGYCCRHKLSQGTLIGLSGARWAWGRWGGNELKLTCQASIDSAHVVSQAHLHINICVDKKLLVWYVLK